MAEGGADARPLDEPALARLRADLARGKRPALVLLAGGAGLPAGSRGHLIRIDDPPQDAEFLHVRVGHDELPFAPEEVGLPGRRSRAGAKSAEAEASSPRTTARPAAEPILEPVRPVAAIEPAGEQRAAPTAPEDKPATPPRTKRAGRSGGDRPAKITLTLRFADVGWTVETLLAGRRDRPQPVPLAAIRAFADQLEDQSLRRQLESTVEACRDEAEKRAAVLRAELAKLETELAALEG